MPSLFALKIKLRAEETFFRNFRCALGARRQMSHNPAMIEMQKLCGEIEKSLYSAYTTLSQIGR